MIGRGLIGRDLIGCGLIRQAHGTVFLEGGICEVFVESGRGYRKKVISSYVLAIGRGIGWAWLD